MKRNSLLAAIVIVTALVTALAHPVQAVETSAVRRQQEAQQRARQMTRELVATILDVQLRQLEENDVAEGFLSVVGDTHGQGAIGLGADPFVRFGVFEVGGKLAHRGSPVESGAAERRSFRAVATWFVGLELWKTLRRRHDGRAKRIPSVRIIVLGCQLWISVTVSVFPLLAGVASRTPVPRRAAAVEPHVAGGGMGSMKSCMSETGAHDRA